MKSLDDYRGVVSDHVLAQIYSKSTKLNNYHLVNINSTYSGGGVAEILHNLTVLMNDIGIDTGWRMLPGPQGFYTTTKRMHNALQGEDIEMDLINKELYLETNEKFAVFTHVAEHDCVIVHDPQPLPFIKYHNQTHYLILTFHHQYPHV